MTGLVARGAHVFGYFLGPMAFVFSLPPRKNAMPWKPTSIGDIARNEAVIAS